MGVVKCSLTDLGKADAIRARERRMEIEEYNASCEHEHEKIEERWYDRYLTPLSTVQLLNIKDICAERDIKMSLGEENAGRLAEILN